MIHIDKTNRMVKLNGQSEKGYGMGGERPDKGTETTARILEAARDEFAEKGFAGARVDTIARRAGVNKATLYYGDVTELVSGKKKGVPPWLSRP